MLSGHTCPKCGSRLVREVSTGGIFFGHTLEDENLHRCYRCFHTFKLETEDD